MLRALTQLFRKPAKEGGRARAEALFKERYAVFKALLDSNAELLQLLADMEVKLAGDTLFGMAYLRTQASRILFHAARMARSFQALSGREQPRLDQALARIRNEIGTILAPRRRERVPDLALSLWDIDAHMADETGAKCANLGEMKRMNLPVPEGFALTTGAYDAFVEHNGLADEIARAHMDIDPADPASVLAASETLQALFLNAETPPEVAQAMHERFDAMCRGLGGRRPHLAMRSSALGEDGDLSFAGQYKTMLNVPPERMAESYALILASLFSPRAVSYRLAKGVPVEETAMSVACLEMVESRASGVAYSRDPLDSLSELMVVNAVWGLGPYAVDGVVQPDVMRLTRDDPPRLVSQELRRKEVLLAAGPGGVLKEQAVAPDEQGRAALTPEQAEILGGHVLALESHFGVPQDVEWAVDQGGRLLLLQARPLRVEDGSGRETPELPEIEDPQPLLAGASIACQGVACGKVHHVAGTEDLGAFPDHAVLVALHSSPSYSLVMSRAAAIVTEHGSATGHMASLTREFGLPALVGAKDALKLLDHGMEVTVDAYSGRVYPGRVEELLSLTVERQGPMLGTPMLELLRTLADIIVPLNLTDPKSPEFAARNCRTVHDVMRFIHERCYGEMFSISDLATEHGTFSRKLEAGLPLDLYVIDLGGGLDEAAHAQTRVNADQVSSAPFKALLQGMLDERLHSTGPKPVNLGGFLSVMSRQMFTPPDAGGQRFGDKSYAIISDAYLNFSSRVGYHYSVVDAYAVQAQNNNYVNFQFKGGAADDMRRNRRVRAIAVILTALGFTVEVAADTAVARFHKFDQGETLKRLEDLGRILQYTRQMDMLMDSEASVDRLAKSFLAGDFHFGQGS